MRCFVFDENKEKKQGGAFADVKPQIIASELDKLRQAFAT